jgi:hypothetical protein
MSREGKYERRDDSRDRKMKNERPEKGSVERDSNRRTGVKRSRSRDRSRSTSRHRPQVSEDRSRSNKVATVSSSNSSSRGSRDSYRGRSRSVSRSNDRRPRDRTTQNQDRGMVYGPGDRNGTSVSRHNTDNDSRMQNSNSSNYSRSKDDNSSMNSRGSDEQNVCHSDKGRTFNNRRYQSEHTSSSHSYHSNNYNEFKDSSHPPQQWDSKNKIGSGHSQSSLPPPPPPPSAPKPPPPPHTNNTGPTSVSAGGGVASPGSSPMQLLSLPPPPRPPMPPPPTALVPPVNGAVTSTASTQLLPLPLPAVPAAVAAVAEEFNDIVADTLVQQPAAPVKQWAVQRKDFVIIRRRAGEALYAKIHQIRFPGQPIDNYGPQSAPPKVAEGPKDDTAEKTAVGGSAIDDLLSGMMDDSAPDKGTKAATKEEEGDDEKSLEPTYSPTPMDEDDAVPDTAVTAAAVSDLDLLLMSVEGTTDACVEEVVAVEDEPITGTEGAAAGEDDEDDMYGDISLSGGLDVDESEGADAGADGEDLYGDLGLTSDTATNGALEQEEEEEEQQEEEQVAVSDSVAHPVASLSGGSGSSGSDSAAAAADDSNLPGNSNGTVSGIRIESTPLTQVAGENVGGVDKGVEPSDFVGKSSSSAAAGRSALIAAALAAKDPYANGPIDFQRSEPSDSLIMVKPLTYLQQVFSFLYVIASSFFTGIWLLLFY